MHGCRALVALLGLLLLAPAASAQTLQFFPYPDGTTYSTGIATAPDGTVWFADEGGADAPNLIRLDPAQAQAGTSNGMQVFPTPNFTGGNSSCCVKIIRSLSYDPTSGRVWFAHSGGVIGFAQASAVSPGTESGMHVLKSFDLGVFPGQIVAGNNGDAWVAENNANSQSHPTFPEAGNRIARVVTNGSDVSLEEAPNLAKQTGTWDSSRFDAKVNGIALDGAGKPWFTEESGGNAGYRIGTFNSAYTEWLVTPPSGSNAVVGPRDIVVANDGTKWFTNTTTKSLVKFDTSSGTPTMTHYAPSTFAPELSGGTPGELAKASDGTLWLTVPNGVGQQAGIVRIDPANASATAYLLGTDKRPLDVTASTDGSVWFTTAPWGGGTSFLGRLGNVITPVDDDDDDDGSNGGTNGGGGGGGGGGTTPAATPAGTPVVAVTRPLVPALRATAVQSDPRVRGTSAQVTQRCVGPPQARCSVIYLLETREYYTGFPGVTYRAGAKKAKRKLRRVTVGRASVSLAGGESRTVTISLNAKGKRLLKRFKRLPATLITKQTVTGAKPTTARKKLRFRTG